MSITQAEFIHHVENGSFDELLSIINQSENEPSSGELILLIKEGIYQTTAHKKWTDFITFLMSNHRKQLAFPEFLIDILDKIIEDERSKENAHHRCCKILLSYVLQKLANTSNKNLTRNYLPHLYLTLIDKQTHENFLNLINSDTEPDISDSYQLLFSIYQINPAIMFQAYLIDKMILPKLANQLNDTELLWLIEKMQSLFISQSKNDLMRLFAYLTDTNKIEPTQALKKISPYSELLRLKKITTNANASIKIIRDMLINEKLATKKLDSIVTNNNDLEILSLTNQMSKFLDGYGNLGINEALLSCAQIANRKPYPFNPVALEEAAEFKHFLTILKSANSPQRVKFIITGSHWITGDIQLDSDGHAKIAFYDSLGAPNNRLLSSTSEAMEVFNKVFPNDPIYFSATKRQHSNKGCSIFALDDLTHLFTIENYLKVDIFDYYEHQSTLSKDSRKLNSQDDMNIHLCDLPLSLMRTTQSLTAIENMKKLTDDSLLMMPINKKGMNFLENISLFYKPASYSSEKMINSRLERAYTKIAAQTAKYLLTHTNDEIMHDKSQFGIDAFQEKNDREHKMGSLPTS